MRTTVRTAAVRSAAARSAAARSAAARSAAAAIAAGVALLLSGCAGGASSGDAVDVAPVPVQPAPVEQADESAAQPLSAEERAVIVTAVVDLVADDPVAAAARAAETATELSGSVADRSESVDDDGTARASITLRVPADAVQEAIDAIRDLGDVRTVQQSELDVTQQVRDLDVRVTGARASVDRLTQLLQSAGDTATLLDVEEQLSQRTTELELLLAEQAALQDQVAMSTIIVSIVTPALAPAEPGTFLDGLATGWAALVAAAGAAVVGIGVALPWLLALAVPAAVVLLVLRRRRDQRLDAPVADGAPD